jgi:hypothetical protein
MKDFQLSLEVPRRSRWTAFLAALRRVVVIEKLQNIFGLIILSVFALIFSFGIANLGASFGVIILAFIITVPLVYALVVNTRFGIFIYLSLAYFMGFLGMSGVSFPMGTLMDGMLLLFIIGFFIQQKKKPDWQRVKGPVSTVILIWVIYTVLEIGNPASESRLTWVYTIRTIGLLALSYFIFLYNIRTKQYLKIVIKIWVLFALIAALYGFKQEFIGFSDAEERYLHSNPMIATLLFLSGHWRKFSVFPDPVTFAYNMVIGSLFCLGLLKGPLSKFKKFALIICIGLMLTAMIFSGTRGAFPLVPATLILYSILNYSKKILVFALIAAVFVIGLIIMPTSNQNILRFQTAFKPNNDASYLVRKINQARIKPYVWSHPIGGGLGSTEQWGSMFAPGSYLAHFPPDSGYVRVMVELGWIGLTLFCVMMFVILKTGINNYYAIKDPELKSYCLGAVLVIFALNIGNFPQEALVQFPSNVLFYLAIAIINVSYIIDKEQNKKYGLQ